MIVFPSLTLSLSPGPCSFSHWFITVVEDQYERLALEWGLIQAVWHKRRFLHWCLQSLGLLEVFCYEMLARVLPLTVDSCVEVCTVNEGRGNGSNWMLGRLNANRIPFPIANFADLATILGNLFRAFAWVLSRHFSLPQLMSSLFSTVLLWLSTSAQVPLPHLVLIALLFPFFIRTRMFCWWLASSDFYCTLCMPPFLQVFVCLLPRVRVVLFLHCLLCDTEQSYCHRSWQQSLHRAMYFICKSVALMFSFLLLW